MTRRELLRTTAVLAAAPVAGCGPMKARLARAIHHCPADVPRPPAGPRVARAMPRDAFVASNGVTALALVPPQSNRIVFAFPGRGGTATDAARDIAGFVDLGAPHAAVVCVGGAESYWHPRADRIDAMHAFLHDVVPWARRTLRLEPPFGAIGWSMGGFGALAAVQRQPALFDRVCAVSPAIWQTYAQQRAAVADAFDGETDFGRYGAFARLGAFRGIGVRLVSGTSDAYFDNARALSRRLAHVTNVAFEPIDPGCHEMETWHRTMPGDFAFVGAA